MSSWMDCGPKSRDFPIGPGSRAASAGRCEYFPQASSPGDRTSRTRAFRKIPAPEMGKSSATTRHNLGRERFSRRWTSALSRTFSASHGGRDHQVIDEQPIIDRLAPQPANDLAGRIGQRDCQEPSVGGVTVFSIERCQGRQDRLADLVGRVLATMRGSAQPGLWSDIPGILHQRLVPATARFPVRRVRLCLRDDDLNLIRGVAGRSKRYMRLGMCLPAPRGKAVCRSILVPANPFYGLAPRHGRGDWRRGAVVVQPKD